jgi:hypothetical protein
MLGIILLDPTSPSQAKIKTTMKNFLKKYFRNKKSDTWVSLLQIGTRLTVHEIPHQKLPEISESSGTETILNKIK